MSDLNDLLARHKEFSTHQHRPQPIRPLLNTVIISCMDARTDPAQLLGLKLGEAVVLRNAGGRVTPEVEQQLGVLAAMVRKSGGPGFDVLVIHHADCGVERLGQPALRAKLCQEAGLDSALLESIAIVDHQQALTSDVERLAASPLLPGGTTITGLHYDPQSGGLDTRATGVCS